MDLMRNEFSRWQGQHEAVSVVGPETGLIQLKATAPLKGTPFHLGEATVTRCVVVVGGRHGYAVVLGHDPERAQIAAYFDALLQDEAYFAELAESLVGPAERAVADRRHWQTAAATATTARFFTSAR